MIAASIIAHLVGDYILQTDAMATRKTSQSGWAALHAATYTLPFLALTRSPLRLAVIAGTHYLIDRYRLARYVVAAKNSVTDWEARRFYFDSPTGYLDYNLSRIWSGPRAGVLMPTASADQGAAVERRPPPPWLAFWLLIIADNTMHLGINAAALTWNRAKEN